jgi:AcrR family transcriptional regulator
MSGSVNGGRLRLSPLDPGSPRPLLAREVVVEFRRRQIESTLAELCVERGYRATTIAAISSRARVARATVYEQFTNKEDIFLALQARAVANLSERIEAACAAAPGDSAARMAAGVAALLAWVAQEPASAWVCFVESLCATPESLRRYLEAIERFTTMLSGAVPSDVPRPLTTEESLIGGVASILSGLVRDGEAQRAPELQPHLMIFLRASFLAVPEQ